MYRPKSYRFGWACHLMAESIKPMTIWVNIEVRAKWQFALYACRFLNYFLLGHKNVLDASSIIFIMSEILFGLPNSSRPSQFSTHRSLAHLLSTYFPISISFVLSCLPGRLLPTHSWMLMIWLFVAWFLSVLVWLHLLSYAIHRTQTWFYSIFQSLFLSAVCLRFLIFFFSTFSAIEFDEAGRIAYAFISLLNL